MKAAPVPKNAFKYSALIFTMLFFVGYIFSGGNDHEQHVYFILAAKYCAVPIFLSVIFIYRRPVFLKKISAKKINSISIFILFVMSAVFISGYYLKILNEHIGHFDRTTIQGNVIEKGTYCSGIYACEKLYLITISENRSGRNIELSVRQREYDKYSVGQFYSDEWNIGSLGFLFRE